MFENERTGVNAGVQVAAQVDSGLRAYMLKVYNYMTMGLLITAFTGLLLDVTGLSRIFYSYSAERGGDVPNVLFWVAVISPLILVFMFSSAVNKLNEGRAKAIFILFSALMGVSLMNILQVYTGTSVFRVFLITAGTFGGMSLWGYTTKKDLSGWGSFLFMGLLGLIIASIVNIFMGSSQMDFIISFVGVGIFVGLTAYDTQRIRNMYHAGDSDAVASSKAISGALSLYLDFINLFIMLLRFFGDRR